MYLLFLLLLLFPQPIQALSNSKEITVSGTVENNTVNINGYTSPNSKVELTSTDTYAQTYSNSEGYFEFVNTILPKNYSELCLVATDDNYRQTTPVCIPPPPHTNYHTDIGPIILPPTLTLDDESINPSETILSSGQGIPNSEVNIYFYKVDDKAPSFVKPAAAYSLPKLTLLSDKDGNFSFSLPTAYSSNYRLYAAVNFNSNPSPKSNTLFYFMPSQFNYLIIYLSIFFVTLISFFILLYYFSKNKLHYLPAIPFKFLPSLKPSGSSSHLP